MKAKTYFKTAEGQQLVKDFRQELIRVWTFKDLARSVIREITPSIESKYQIKPDPENFAEYFLISYVDKFNMPLEYDSIINGAKAYAETLAAKFRSDQPVKGKPYKSKDWAYGIALAMGYLNGKIQPETWISEQKRADIAVNMGIGNKGFKAAKFAKDIYPSGSKPKEAELIRYQNDKDRQFDFKYAMKLFNEYDWPD